jgi:hypothetical protein
MLPSLRDSACAEPKTVRPLRTAAGQGAVSTPRTTKATSSSCCTSRWPGLVPSQKQYGRCAPQPVKDADSKPRTAEATSSSCCSRCGRRPVPSQNSTAAAHSSRPRGRQHATHRRSNEQLVLLSSRTSACAEPKQYGRCAQQPVSAPRTAKATSSSCCSRCGPRPAPSEKH